MSDMPLPRTLYITRGETVTGNGDAFSAAESVSLAAPSPTPVTTSDRPEWTAKRNGDRGDWAVFDEFGRYAAYCDCYREPDNESNARHIALCVNIVTKARSEEAARKASRGTHADIGGEHILADFICESDRAIAYQMMLSALQETEAFLVARMGEKGPIIVTVETDRRRMRRISETVSAAIVAGKGGAA